MTDDYKILQNSRGYILINTKGGYENHGYMKKIGTCLLLIKLMEKKQVPYSKYLQEAALRISTDEKYKEKILIKQQKDKNKTRYVNVNKGAMIK